jgi:hypothetical protein
MKRMMLALEDMFRPVDRLDNMIRRLFVVLLVERSEAPDPSFIDEGFSEYTPS